MILQNHTTAIVNPFDIDLTDQTCFIPCFSDLNSLINSIRCSGIINAPLVTENDEGTLIPILGRRRIEAARALNLVSISVGIVHDLTPQQAYATAFWDNTETRLFTAAYWAVVTKRLLEMFTKIEVAENFLKPLGCSVNGPKLERFRMIGGLEHNILELLANGKLQEKTALILAKMDAAERSVIMDFAETLGLNLNKMTEIITNIYDLSIFHGTSVIELINHEQIQAVLHEDRPLPERAEKIRFLIRSRKFPELVREQQEFSAWIKSLPQVKNMAVRYDQTFEDRTITLEIKLDSRDEVRKIMEMPVKGEV